MLLAILVLIIVGGVTYFHYLQGGLTSTISAVCAIFAAIVAFGYYETLVAKLQPGAIVDQANAVLLVCLFAFTYIILRVIFDMAVPGNIRLPLWVDRGCAVVFGLIAAVMCGGVFAVGAQMLPFGAAGGIAARYEMRNRSVIVPREFAGTGARNDQDYEISNELIDEAFDKSNVFDPSRRTAMILPADDLVLSLVSAASENAFSGSQKFRQIHPDLGLEAFANRLGADPGVRRVVVNGDKEVQVSVPAERGLSLLTTLSTVADTEIPSLRMNSKSLTYAKDPSKKLLVIRALFKDSAADQDGYIRVPTAAARLVIDGKTFYPIGTLEQNGTLAVSRLDDFIVLQKNDRRGGDFVYPVDSAVLDKINIGGKIKSDAPVFVEFKLMGRIDLNGVAISPDWAPSDKTGVLRKKGSPLITPSAKK